MRNSDERWMRRALALARLSEGFTRPNPPVGAVVVKNGARLGEGRHIRAGEAHAEVNALDSCTGSAAGATLYVTLEPCSTTGRQPPCTDRIIREKIKRVVIGCIDENAKHQGRGIDILRARGIEVETGACESAAREIAEPFFKFIRTGRPFVTLKLGMTLDGRIADALGKSRWITGEKARAAVQEFRRRADAVLVGAGTIAADNPSLLCRIGRGFGSNLLRVVVDARGLIPKDAQVLTDAAASRTIVATTRAAEAAHGPELSAHGARIWTFKPRQNGKIPIADVLARLGREESVMHVLCEGGGRIAGSLRDENAVDEYALFYAPVILGSVRAVSGFDGIGALLADATRLSIRSCRRLGDDVLLMLR